MEFAMPHAHVGNIELYYEVEGDLSAPPLVLIPGQGAQLISWRPEFRALLLQAGFRVIVFDNRDTGLSTKLVTGEDYELSNMAADVAGILDHLGIQAAHIVGQSMGGMIAQLVAIEHPDRVLSLCSIYSSPGPAYITTTTTHPEVWAVRERPPAHDRESAIAEYIERERSSGLAEYSEEWIRAYAEETIDRCYYPDGRERQMEAVRRSADRTSGLRELAVPTTVLHGLDDLLIDVAGGIATAGAVPGAELHTYAEMGHQIVPSLCPDYVRAIRRNADRVAAHPRSTAHV